MTTRHTPGPWEWRHNSASDANTVCIEIRPGGPYRGDVASLQSCENIFGITMAETEANARLIAAAPTMYAFIEKRATQGDPEAIQILGGIHANS